MNIEENFKNHVATLKEYGDIKILRFKNPETSNYFIQFLFDEAEHTLMISGDLGYLVAQNYNNMTLEGFNNFVNNPSYFEEKIRCCSRPLYEYDEDYATEQLKEYFKDYELIDDIREKYEVFEDDSDEECIERAIRDILMFSNRDGIGAYGYEKLTDIYADAFEWQIGMKRTEILSLYWTAYTLAMNQLNK